MNPATTKQITSAANKHNEDLVPIYGSAHITDTVIMDGACSVAIRNFIDIVIGDVAWFVRTFRRVAGASYPPGPLPGGKRIARDKYFTRCLSAENQRSAGDYIR